MKRIIVKGIGEPREVLAVQEVEDLIPGPGEVVVKWKQFLSIPQICWS